MSTKAEVSSRAEMWRLNCEQARAERDEARAALATLQAENAELRDKVVDLVSQLGSADALDILRVDRIAASETESAERLRKLIAAEGEAATLRERLEAAEFTRDDLATAYNDQVNAHATTEARATAAEGERDRLRELIGLAAEKIAGKVSAQFPWCEVCGGNLRTGRGHSKACYIGAFAAHLAAIPHTEGEASAPPKETPR